MIDFFSTRLFYAVRDGAIAGGFLFLSLWCPTASSAQEVPVREAVPDSARSAARDSLAADSLSVDSLAVAQAAAVIDTVLPLRTHGRVMLTDDPATVDLTKYDIRLSDYNGLFELVERSTHAYPLSLGKPGAMNHVSFYGAAPRDVAVGYNGRSLVDPALGFYSLDHFPVEALERVEVLTGTYAAVFADNATGAYINLQEIRYNTRRPFTRIWYHQGGYNHIASDGVYSQNVSDRVNITAGFRRQSARGRFENSYLDTWNVRGVVRWNVGDYTNLSLSDVFTSHYTETNGGVDAGESTDIGNALTAQVEYPELDERVYRHDVTLTLSSYLADDSTTSVSGSAYVSHALWEKDRVRTLAVSPSDTVNLVSFVTRRIGVTGGFEQRLRGLLVAAGGKIEQLMNEGTVYFADNRDIESSAYGLVSLFPFAEMKLTAGIRARFAEEKVHLAAGVRGDLEVNNHLRLFADLSRSVRTPSVLEGTHLLSEEHLLGLAGVRWREGNHGVDLTVFYRNEQNAIVTLPVATTTGTVIAAVFDNADAAITTFGAMLSYEGRVGSIVGSVFANITATSADGERIERFPLLYAGATLMYEYAVGRSALRAGVRVRGLTSFQGEQYLPVVWSYVPVEEASGIRGNGLDLLASATLGNAVLRASYNNLFGQTWYYVPFYPQEEGVFRLSVSWAFLD